MTNKNLNSALLFLLTVTLSSITLAREITVSFGQYQPPYVMHQEHDRHPHVDGRHMHGIEIDILIAALALNGHTLKSKLMKKTEVKSSLKSDETIDAASAVDLSKDHFYYSDKIIEHEALAISKEKGRLRINSVNDLKGYRIAMRSNANMALGVGKTHEFNSIYKSQPEKNKFASQLQQNIAFWSDQVEIIITDRHIFNYYKKMLEGEFNTAEQKMKLHTVFAKKTPFYVAFKNEALRDQFNISLNTLKKSGEYQAIIDRYIK